MIIEVNEESFETEVLESEGTVLVDFYATWCGPCKVLDSILKKIDEEYNIKICKINTDENGMFATQYGISALPTVIVFRNGEKIQEIVSLKSPDTYSKAIQG